MASFSNIEIKEKLRPCFVKNKKALFHKWVHKKNIYQEEFEVGIVEYENGQVEEVRPNNIKFCDNEIYEYSFKEEI